MKVSIVEVKMVGEISGSVIFLNRVNFFVFRILVIFL